MLGINIKIIVSNTHFIVVERSYLFLYCLNKLRFKFALKKKFLKFTQILPIILINWRTNI